MLAPQGSHEDPPRGHGEMDPGGKGGGSVEVIGLLAVEHPLQGVEVMLGGGFS